MKGKASNTLDTDLRITVNYEHELNASAINNQSMKD